MLTATTQDGEMITLVRLSKQAINRLRREEVFYCPACHSPVIVKAGDVITPHFAHIGDNQCPKGSGGESDYHYKGKLLLYEWFLHQQIDVSLEPYLPSIQQRPDLLIRLKGRLIAIEFQCAKIDVHTIYKRNQGYKLVNIIPIWILGANQLKRISSHHIQVNQFTLSFIHRFAAKHPTVLFYFCPHTKQFSFIRDLIIVSSNRALAKQTFHPLSHITFYHLFSRTYFTNEQLFSLWIREKRKFRLRSSQPYGQERTWRNWLYEKQLHIDYLPTHIFLPIRSQYNMKVPLWNWQSHFLLDFMDQFQIGEVFTLVKAEKYLKKFMRKKVDRQMIRFDSHPIAEYLQLLCQIGLIVQIGEGIFKKQQKLTFYKQIEKALAGDDDLLIRFMYNRI